MKRFLCLLGFMALPLLGQKVTLTASSVVPAAVAQVNLGHDQNSNTTVDLKVQHLALPSSLTPAKQVYLVWVQPAGQAPQREGELHVGSDLKGEIKFVTPARHFDLIISAEDSAAASSPEGTEVLRGAIAR